jgi:hypothetical protein
MRDIIVTEYGIANIQGLSDEQCAIEMLKIADSRFQDSLLSEAKKYKKIAHDYVLPDKYKNNYPTRVSGILKAFKQQGFYGPFPFGSDLTDEEYTLGKALKKFVVDLRDNKIITFLRVAVYIFAKSPKKFQKHLVRMGLNQPKNIDERFQRAIVISALDKMTTMAET